MQRKLFLLCLASPPGGGKLTSVSRDMQEPPRMVSATDAQIVRMGLSEPHPCPSLLIPSARWVRAPHWHCHRVLFVLCIVVS